MVTYMNFPKKNAFSKSVFELETSFKDQNICQQYAISLANFHATLTNLGSPDVKNLIFGKTAITPSFFCLKTSNQN